MSTMILYYSSMLYLGAIALLPNHQSSGFNVENSLVERNDDVSFEELQSLVQQQASVIQQQAAAIQALQARMTAMETKEAQADTKITALEKQIRKQGKLRTGSADLTSFVSA